nr:calcium-binding protein [uncultured Sphingosinicella sp.]
MARIEGTSSNDTLFGFDDQNDELFGLDGNDVLDGRSGADRMVGGTGNETYVVDDQNDEVVEFAGEGFDAVSTKLRFYRLGDHLEALVYTGTFGFEGLGNGLDNEIRGGEQNDILRGFGGADTLIGNAGDDLLDGGEGDDQLAGGAGDDIFFLQHVGDDLAFGGAGNDGFYLGAAFTAADILDGGEGALDQVALQGGYSGLTFAAGSLVGVEQLVLLPGSDARFGDTSGALYSYNLTTVDANVAAGKQLIVTSNTLRVGEDLTLNGSAETDGSFLTFGGKGVDQITGGQGSDGFFFGIDKRFGDQDAIDGQGGSDQVGLQGDYSGANKIVFGEAQLKNVEFIVALTGGDARFGNNGLGYSYDLTTSDGNVASGANMIVSANTLRSDETLTFNGSAETDGRFQIFSGAGADRITGGSGADRISGGRGADVLRGGDGADVFIYTSVADSTSTAFDQIVGFDYTADKIDLPTTVGNFSDAVEGSLSLSTFNADLTAALNGVLGIGEAAAFQATSGDMAGRIFGIVDANGIAGYQAGEDFVIEFVTPLTAPDPTIDFLI